MRRVSVALALCLGGLAVRPAAASEPPPCTPAPAGHATPWEHNSRILSSFPRETPPPRFIGAFGDPGRRYELQLWHDRSGVFGQLLGPVLAADSPTSRLSGADLDPGSRVLRFTARFLDGTVRFEGVLTDESLRGSVGRGDRTEPVDLFKLPPSATHGAVEREYASRAQFECEMVLFRRY